MLIKPWKIIWVKMFFIKVVRHQILCGFLFFLNIQEEYPCSRSLVLFSNQVRFKNPSTIYNLLKQLKYNNILWETK